MNQKIKKIFFTGFLIAAMFLPGIILNIAAFSETNNGLNAILAQYGIGFRQDKPLTVKTNYKIPFKNKVFHTIIAQNKKTRIEIVVMKPMSEKEAIDLSKSKYIIIKSLYEPQIIPYSGRLTHATDCPDKNKPEEIIIEIMEKPIRVILANATERYILGVWEEDLIKQKSAFVVVYDSKNSTLYQIIIFQPFDSFDRNEVLSILTNLKPAQKN